jgi:HK97 gp10 family phage protein
MANTQTIKIEGVDSIIRRLMSLPDNLKKSGEKAALRAGGVPIRKAAKQYAKSSKDSGLLIKSIGLNVKTVRGITSVRVGPRKGFRQKVQRKDKRTGKMIEVIADPSNYGHLVEYGTSHSTAKPFIRPAVDQTQGEVLGAMAKGLEKHLIRKMK